MKLKRALSIMNKSKQSQEYEALLQQTEQEFNLQSQTLMQELTRLSEDVQKLEKENSLLKSQTNSTEVDGNTESELRRLQAQNTVLKTSLESLQLKHKEELDQMNESMKQIKVKHASTDSLDTVENSTPNLSNGSDWKDPLSVNDEVDGESSTADETSTTNHSENSFQSIVADDRLLHAEAQCQRLKQQLQQLQDINVQYETEREEKNLLQIALDEETNRRLTECKALNTEIESYREKLDRKQASYIHLQDEKENLFKECQNKASEITALRDSSSIQLQAEKEKLSKEITSLGNALQTSHNLLEQQQASMAVFQKQVDSLEEEKKMLAHEKDQLQQCLEEAQQSLSSQEQLRFEQTSQTSKFESQIASLNARLEKAATERDDAVTKFEENARASGALLQRVDQVEHDNEKLRHELQEAKELAEKRKKVMDKQAIESQEHNAKFTERIVAMQAEFDSATQRTTETYAEKEKVLEETCKRQEQELIRMNHQDRTKTREIDSIQQQLRDLQSNISSVENSRGWFERALKDAEKVAEEKQAAHLQKIQDLKSLHAKEFEGLKVRLSQKDEEIAEVERRLAEANEEIQKREEVKDRLKQDIQDEKSKQKLVEKKGHTALKDLKRQLAIEKKRNEKLQEKLQEISSNQSNVDELLQVVDGHDTSATGGDGSSVSSFSFRDFMSSSKQSDSHSQAGTSSLSSTPVTSVNVSKAESRDLLSRVTVLQQDKWQLEEQVRHLEESAGAMADELMEKTKLIQQYVQHTRTDVHKVKASNEELGSSRSIRNRVRSVITGQDDADVANIRELNRKLTRMLEEEMTKNMALKEDLANLSMQLAKK
uniref:GRIP1-associated protein 1-like n=1 Tax=Phallusia mammillata TaxID=59560 RepID=A0A6F9DDE2_9ASCI|nr:GRIP1-associated protein 1-like [Phallusia mammillata]